MKSHSGMNTRTCFEKKAMIEHFHVTPSKEPPKSSSVIRGTNFISVATFQLKKPLWKPVHFEFQSNGGALQRSKNVYLLHRY